MVEVNSEELSILCVFMKIKWKSHIFAFSFHLGLSQSVTGSNPGISRSALTLQVVALRCGIHQEDSQEENQRPCGIGEQLRLESSNWLGEQLESSNWLGEQLEQHNKREGRQTGLKLCEQSRGGLEL